MAWTRRFFDQWEWYHKPISPMEESLLLPQHINRSTALFSKRLGIRFPAPEQTWKVIDGWLYFTDRYRQLFLQAGIIGLPGRFFGQLPIVKDHWLKEVQPKYQKRIDELKRLILESCKNDELVDLVKKTVDTEGDLMAESMYVVLFAVPGEVALKYAYKTLAGDPNPSNYRELLVGFPDRGIEADVVLWKISQITDGAKQKAQLDKWLNEFGHRIQDKDIVFPTLGENAKMAAALIKLYKGAPSPALRVKAAVKRRESREEYVKEHVGSWAWPFFEAIKKTAQEYARVRNSRPFYYQGNQLIRKMLITLAGRLPGINDPQDVFFVRFDELEKAVKIKTSENIKEKIKERKAEYHKRLLTEPPLTIND